MIDEIVSVPVTGFADRFVTELGSIDFCCECTGHDVTVEWSHQELQPAPSFLALDSISKPEDPKLRLHLVPTVGLHQRANLRAPFWRKHDFKETVAFALSFGLWKRPVWIMNSVLPPRHTIGPTQLSQTIRGAGCISPSSECGTDRPDIKAFADYRADRDHPGVYAAFRDLFVTQGRESNPLPKYHTKRHRNSKSKGEEHISQKPRIRVEGTDSVPKRKSLKEFGLHLQLFHTRQLTVIIVVKSAKHIVNFLTVILNDILSEITDGLAKQCKTGLFTIILLIIKLKKQTKPRRKLLNHFTGEYDGCSNTKERGDQSPMRSQIFEEVDVRTFLEDFEEAARAAGLDTARGKLAALETYPQEPEKDGPGCGQKGPSEDGLCRCERSFFSRV
ncbi:hypothetical protein T265_11080 [Opisthorchis viverrini]|uniref:Uncharacterized protein n=1 Tax=Opisthorchis viverrini TaxID=6198 RepID=A0A074Z090_OPIVI|nr:hypothetical protein T265_11080 [Opisthorchis viverrini]KER20343.1 hypothetical protein T265_11080 [Opisthorchis viverrini]